MFTSMLRHMACGTLIFVAGCDLGDQVSAEPFLDSSADQKSFTYPVEQTFSLVLDLNADAGYQWFYSATDTTVVHLDSTTYRSKNSNPNVCGGMTVATFHFRTVRAGTSSITLAERQGWMPNDPPLHLVRFKVVVYSS